MTPPTLSRDTALFLDFDGTLVELAPTPDAVIVPDGLRDALTDVSAMLDGALAIISGRQLDDVSGFLAPLTLPMSGSHGMERRRADGSMVDPGAEVRDAAIAIRTEIAERLGDVPGVMIENKHWSPSVHHRAAPDKTDLCRTVVEDVLQSYPDWHASPGKMVVEIRYLETTKGDAVKAFMEETPFAGRTPVFVGDDKSDEDGMRAAAALGGFGIKIGSGDSIARYRLESPADMLKFLLKSSG